MSRPAALRPGSHSSIIIPGPDLQDWTALAPGPRHCMLRVAQLPRLACAACVRARSSLRPCGASLLALARRRKHDQPVRFSGSSEPWESSLGRRLIIRQCRGERGLPRPCSLVALEYLERVGTLRCGGRTGVRIYCRQCFAYGRLAGICGIDICRFWELGISRPSS